MVPFSGVLGAVPITFFKWKCLSCSYEIKYNDK